MITENQARRPLAGADAPAGGVETDGLSRHAARSASCLRGAAAGEYWHDE
jgi:hypothetical protein